MAEGGEFGCDDPALDDNLDNDDDNEEVNKNDYDSEKEQPYSPTKSADTTRPFQPGAASTPYHGGE